jgi:competence protein ComFC
VAVRNGVLGQNFLSLSIDFKEFFRTGVHYSSSPHFASLSVNFILMWDFLKDFLFPRACVGCGQWGEYLCPDCLNFIKTNDKPICPVCYQPAVYGLTHPICRQQRPWSLDGLTSIFTYQGIVKKTITKLKYKFVTDLGETILELFLSFCGDNKAFTKFVTQKNVCLVPVPLYWQRKNWRGFNQAELLGKVMAEKLSIGFLPDLLIRVRQTKEQTKLKKEKRLKNVKGAFKFNQEYNSEAMKQLNLVVFDDVWTTGATMKECAQVLKRNHFKKVWGLTLAR